MIKPALTSHSELAAANASLVDKSPQEIIRWALDLGMRSLVTTTFGDHSAVLLHMLKQIEPDLPVLWVDTGYNTSATYRFAQQLTTALDLNLKVYNPLMSSARRNVLMRGIPEVDEPLHEEFTRQVKLEPFKRAMSDLRPELWFAGIRSDQTDFRKSLDFVSRTRENYLKVAPLLAWDEARMDEYLLQHDLPNEADYFDPTKAQEARECGLHTTL